MYNDYINTKKGFTLIELIVSVTIIAVLTAIAVVNFGGTNKKARDGRRMSDLEKVRVALEIYRQEKGTYPLSGGGSVPASLVPNYMQATPLDPKTGFSYYYIGSGYSYTLDAQMENLGSTNFNTGGNNCGGPLNCNYRVISP